MNKSLLELLEEEKKEIINIKYAKESSADFLRYIEEKRPGYEESSCRRIAKSYEEQAKASEEKLTEIRKELKKYLSFLMQF